MRYKQLPKVCFLWNFFEPNILSYPPSHPLLTPPTFIWTKCLIFIAICYRKDFEYVLWFSFGEDKHNMWCVVALLAYIKFYRQDIQNQCVILGNVRWEHELRIQSDQMKNLEISSKLELWLLRKLALILLF